ncbi:hypothetical protein C8R44DRAFT_871671 [Mycena epipterygia]|nr:hypothetical protein C8R44DRAFT_871671 [Mycena epipterygia]
MPPARTLCWESDETRDYDYPPISPDDLSDLLTPPPQSPSSADPSRPPRTRHTRIQPAGHIPRPPNAFILFRSSLIRSQRVPSAVEPSHSTLSKIIGLTWQHLPEAERSVWHAKALEASEEHRRRFPAYAFRPQNGVHAPKRKTREHEMDDPVRCEKIAELLVEGKHRSALDAAVQEFDRDRVPANIVARFEPPITATAYHRSSSAPVEPEPPGFLVTTSARRRSSSSRPPRRSPNGSDLPAGVKSDVPDSTQNCAVDNFLSPWATEAEAPYFAFSAFSFSPTAGSLPTFPDFSNEPSGEFTCTPLWMGLDSSPTSSDFKLAAHPEPMDIGALIAEDWARAAPSAGYPPFVHDSSQPQYDSDHIAPSYFGGVENPASQPCYLAESRPSIDSDLALLMAQYSLGA